MTETGAILDTGGAVAVEPSGLQGAETGSYVPCANCRQPLQGPYCAFCGQPHDVHRRSVFGLLRDFLKDIASLDSRILRTARALMLQPGLLTAAFREGRTQPYVPAVRLYLFVSLLFFLTLAFSRLALVQFELNGHPVAVQFDAAGHPYAMEDGEVEMLPKRYGDGKRHFSLDPGVTFFTRLGSRHSHISPDALANLTRNMRVGDADSAAAPSWKHRALEGTIRQLAVNPGALNGAITEWLPRVLFGLLPLFALLLAAVYWRRHKEFYFVDHLVFSLNFHSFGFVLLLLGALAAQFLPGADVAWGMWGLLSLYLLLALHRVYRQSWIKTGVKFVLVGGIYSMFFVLPAFVAIVLLSVFGI